MGTLFHIANSVSSGLFRFYGLACLLADGMIDAFERYGLSRFRRMTGALEVLGAAGLAAGYLFSVLSVLSAGGLAILVLLGLAVRVKVGDSFVEMIPAAFLFSVNGFMATQSPEQLT